MLVQVQVLVRYLAHAPQQTSSLSWDEVGTRGRSGGSSSSSDGRDKMQDGGNATRTGDADCHCERAFAEWAGMGQGTIVSPPAKLREVPR